MGVDGDVIGDVYINDAFGTAHRAHGLVVVLMGVVVVLCGGGSVVG